MGRELFCKYLAVRLTLGLVVMMLVPTAAMAQATPCADLRITNFVVNPDSPVQGAQGTVRIVVQNQGTCAAPGFVVQWRQDLLAPTGPSAGLAGLDAGASVTVDLPFIFPQAGNFLTIATVDTANSVAETNEVNNFQILSVTVQTATVDLLVTSITFAPAPVVQGRTATASVVVTNQGRSPSAPFVVEWHPFLFANALTIQTPELGAGESRTIPFDFSFPFPATLDTWASVDTTGAVGETNEFNNTFATRVVVEPPLPDLVVASFTLNPPAPVPGRTATATIVVRNEGNDPAGPFQVDWRPWFFGPLLSRQVNSLAVNATATLTLDYTFPFPGAFDSFITVDSTGRVAEVDESNNTRQVQISLAPNTVDLTITDVVVTPTTPVQGAPATVAITIRNNGNTPAAPFVLEWNPDAFFIVTPSLQTVSQQLTGLGAGETRTVTLNFTYPRAGNFNTVASVDAFGNIAESVETNNLFVRSVTVAPAPIDLVITSFALSPVTPVRFAQTSAIITVRNNGPIATNDFFVQWKLKDSDEFGPIAFTNGLNPGESRTLTLTGGVYFDIGTFTSQAIVDVFNAVVEPGGRENNNTVSTAVTVQPLTTTVRVTLQNLHVINDLDGADPDEEKPIVFGVLNPRDPQGTCSIDLPFQNQTLNGLKCLRFTPDLEDGDDFSPNASIDVTLQDFEPLVAAVSMLDSDVIPPDEYMGVAAIVRLPPSFAPLGPQTIDGQACEESDGKCFTVTLSVSIVGSNAPDSAGAFTDTAALTTPNPGVAGGDSPTDVPVTTVRRPATAGDFDGDGKTDIAVYRPASHDWRILESSTDYSTSIETEWGDSSVVPVAGDYDGDGKADMAYYRPLDGTWFMLNSGTSYSTNRSVVLGTDTDIPVPGDYDGDAVTDVAVYSPVTGQWQILKSSTDYATSFVTLWGASGDIPVPGDYDGDGKVDLAVYRPSTAQWCILQSSTDYTTNLIVVAGASGDITMPGDYDGDGRTDIATYRPSDGTWNVWQSTANYSTTVALPVGTASDIPAVGDFDGDGKADSALYQSGTWNIRLSSVTDTTSTSVSWGESSDVPLSAHP